MATDRGNSFSEYWAEASRDFGPVWAVAVPVSLAALAAPVPLIRSEWRRAAYLLPAFAVWLMAIVPLLVRANGRKMLAGARLQDAERGTTDLGIADLASERVGREYLIQSSDRARRQGLSFSLVHVTLPPDVTREDLERLVRGLATQPLEKGSVVRTAEGHILVGSRTDGELAIKQVADALERAGIQAVVGVAEDIYDSFNGLLEQAQANAR